MNKKSFLKSQGYEIIAGNEYSKDNKVFLIVNNAQASKLAREYITESLWAFNPKFLSDITGFDQSIFEAIQSNDRCEDNNDSIKSLVGKKLKYLIDEAIKCDGRGHFINSYDGEENEIGGYFLYRID